MNFISKRIAVVLLLFLVIIGIFFTFKWWMGSKNVKALYFVPNSAIWAIEVKSPLVKFDDLKQKSFWPLYSLSNHGKTLDETVSKLSKLLKLDENKTTIFADKKIIISAHILNSKSIDFLFLAPLVNAEDKDLIGASTELLKANPGVRYQTREFENHEIHEFTDKMSKETFSYIVHKSFIIASYSGVLVEDAIRTINKGEKASFYAILPKQDKELEGNDFKKNSKIFINYKNLSKLNAYLFDAEPAKLLNFVSNLANESTLDYEPNEKSLIFNGVTSVNNKGTLNFLNIFKWQTASLPKVQNFIPTNAAAIYYWGFENGKNLRTSLSEYWLSNNLPIAWAAVNQKHSIDISNLYNWFGKETALVLLDSYYKSEINKVLYIHTKDVVRATEDFARLQLAVGGQSLTIHSGNNVVQVKKINISNLPAKLLGYHFSGFNEVYVSSIQDFIIISNNIENIATVHNSFAAETVWGLEPQLSRALFNGTSGSSLALLVNSNKAWTLFADKANKNKVNVMPSLEKQFKSFEMFTMKYTNIGDKFMTSLGFGYQSQKVELAIKDTLTNTSQEVSMMKDVKSISIGSILNQPLLQPINLNENNTDYLLQDVSNQLYAFTKEGEKLFAKPLDGAIVTKLYALDFNHFAFATAKSLYVITRKGENFSSFPVSLPNASIDKLSIFDYDKKREYRFFVSDSKGILHLFDKKGTVPSTWNLMDFKASFAENPKHVNIAGKDVIYNVLTNNTLHVINRKGEPYAGFPIKLASKVSSDAVIEKGSNLEESIVRTITNSGIFYMVNLAGKTLLNKQLMKPTKDTKFEIISSETANNHWVICRNEGNRITFLNHDFQEIFSLDIQETQNAKVKYYFYGSDKIYYLIYLNGLSYLYDAKGNLLDNKALQCSALPMLMENHDEYLYVCPQTNSIVIKKF